MNSKLKYIILAILLLLNLRISQAKSVECKGWYINYNNDNIQAVFLAPATLFGEKFDYFDGDYNRSGNAVTSLQGSNFSLSATNANLAPQLFNGTIRGVEWQTNMNPAWQAALTGIAAFNLNKQKCVYAYKYDDKYQLIEANFGRKHLTNANSSYWMFHTDNGNYVQTTNPASSFFAFQFNQNYKVFNLDYDANGNIQHLKRNAYGSNPLMDNLTYNYSAGVNKLDRISEASTSTQYASNEFPFATATGSQYIYNEIGELIADLNKDEHYYYNASGLVTSVTKHSTPNFTKASFTYNDAGKRLTKTSYQVNGTGQTTPAKTTWYINDGFAIYEHDFLITPTLPVLKEVNVNASGRIGTYYYDVDKYVYEISDHLGNVRTTFTPSKKNTFSTSFDNTSADDYLLSQQNVAAVDPDDLVVGANPTFYPALQYSGGFFDFDVIAGNTITVTYDFSSQFPIHNANGVMMVCQPSDANYNPSNWMASSLPIVSSINGFTATCTFTIPNNTSLAHASIYLWNNTTQIINLNSLSISINDANSGYEVPLQESFADYYPHGSIMPGRNVQAPKHYRHGYQGQYTENDEETGLINFDLRMYDPLIGRWFAPDPEEEFFSPYLAMGNDPINRLDPTGGNTGGFEQTWDETTQSYSAPKKVSDVGDDTGDNYYKYNGGYLDNGKILHTWGQVGSMYAKFENPQMHVVPNNEFTGPFYGSDAIQPDYTIESFVIGGIATKPIFGVAGRVVSKVFSKSTTTVQMNVVSKVIDAGKQGKHIIGHNNYLPGRSILTEDAQGLLDAFHSGQVTTSQVINAVKTRVNFGKTIGNFVKDGVSTPTTKGIIINAKNGAHIVPSAPY